MTPDDYRRVLADLPELSDDAVAAAWEAWSHALRQAAWAARDGKTVPRVLRRTPVPPPPWPAAPWPVRLALVTP